MALASMDKDKDKADALFCVLSYSRHICYISGSLGTTSKALHLEAYDMLVKSGEACTHPACPVHACF